MAYLKDAKGDWPQPAGMVPSWRGWPQGIIGPSPGYRVAPPMYRELAQLKGCGACGSVGAEEGTEEEGVTDVQLPPPSDPFAAALKAAADAAKEKVTGASDPSAYTPGDMPLPAPPVSSLAMPVLIGLGVLGIFWLTLRQGKAPKRASRPRRVVRKRR